MICPKCGKENEDDAKFCAFCGNALTKDKDKAAAGVAAVSGAVVGDAGLNAGGDAPETYIGAGKAEPSGTQNGVGGRAADNSTAVRRGAKSNSPAGTEKPGTGAGSGEGTGEPHGAGGKAADTEKVVRKGAKSVPEGTGKPAGGAGSGQAAGAADVIGQKTAGAGIGKVSGAAGKAAAVKGSSALGIKIAVGIAAAAVAAGGIGYFATHQPSGEQSAEAETSVAMVDETDAGESDEEKSASVMTVEEMTEQADTQASETEATTEDNEGSTAADSAEPVEESSTETTTAEEQEESEESSAVTVEQMNHNLSFAHWYEGYYDIAYGISSSLTGNPAEGMTMNQDGIVTQTTFQYEDGRLVRKVTTSEGNEGVSDYSYTYEYGENGIPTVVSFQFEDYPEERHETSYTQDDSGRLLTYEGLEPPLDQATVDNTFSYDDEGRLISQEATELDYIEHFTYTYDDGRLVELNRREEESGFPDNLWTFTFSYDENGEMTAINNEDGSSAWEFVYDSDGNLIDAHSGDGSMQITYQYSEE